jgi:rSAM/selenodomain-associated transferase 2
MAGLSVIVPALNAADALPACLNALAAGREARIDVGVTVVDGGSTDQTRETAAAYGADVIAAPGGRGPQLAAGARAAATPWLLFLHADTRLQPGWEAAVTAHIGDPGMREIAAVFRLAFDDDSPAARRTAAVANWRTRRLGLPYGDQGLLMSRALYDAVGGYPELPLMEDVAMARRLGWRRIRMLDATAVTRADKYRRDGWWRRSAGNLTLLSLYFLGVPPERLAKLYR